MAKTIKITNIDIGSREFNGRAIYWGDPADSASGAISDGSGGLITIWAYMAELYGSHYYRSRTLIEIDLSAIPRNSHIQAALLNFKGDQWLDDQQAFVDPTTFAIYPCETVPWVKVECHQGGICQWSCYPEP